MSWFDDDDASTLKSLNSSILYSEHLVNISLISQRHHHKTSFDCNHNCRVAEQSEETLKLRPMRVIQEDKVVRPYVAHDAEGNQVLQVGDNDDDHDNDEHG